MIIMLMRHAESKKEKLTGLGKKQIKLALKSKEKIKFAKIYCSSSERCIKTARYFQHKLKLNMEISENLRDRQLLPNSEPQNEREQEWYDNYLNPMYSSKEPEGCKEYLTRNFIEFKKIIDEHFEKNENVMIIAHSGTLYALSAYINGIQKGKNINWLRMGNCNKVYYEILEKI